MRSILEEAASEESWLAFLNYKLTKQHLDCREEALLRGFVQRKAYLPLCEDWKNQVFPKSLPVKKLINKGGTAKKRIVYSFPGDEGIFLKFIAFQLFRYDSFFCENCYAFRRGFGVQDAFRRIRSMPGLSDCFCLKVDISNYFNSIDVGRLLADLDFIRRDDLPLYQLFTRILTEERVEENGHIVTEAHGAMAGISFSPFLANVYLTCVDHFFQELGAAYFRYSDDILIFAESRGLLAQYQKLLYDKLSALGLTLNPHKVHVSLPGEPWEFLGFGYHNGEIDLSDNTLRKAKAKIKRKADALRRWQRKKGLSEEKAAIGLIHAMNRKFYGSCSASKEKEDELQEHNDFTWSRWFFPNHTTDKGLKELDSYLQEYIRYAVTGRHYKGNYRIRYESLKKWGYRSLVHEYYAGR